VKEPKYHLKRHIVSFAK